MNDSNPYKSPSTTSELHSWRLIDFFVAGLWAAIPVGAFALRRVLLPVFDDFGVELPAVAPYLLHFYSPYLLAIASAAVLLAMFVVPYGKARRRFVGAACISGVLIVAVYSLSMLGPLFLLSRALN